MESVITVHGIRKNGNRIVYDFTFSDALKPYFTGNDFFLETEEGELAGHASFSLSGAPDSVLIIPFLCNVLPIAWVLNVAVKVKELDKDFFGGLDAVKKGYSTLYPLVKFEGKLLVETLVDNTAKMTGPKNNITFFSGGVDAFNTLINHLPEKPILFTVWGADVFFDDIKGWNIVKSEVIKTAEQFGLKRLFIKSNFRGFINGPALNAVITKTVKDSWWHAIQCGMGLVGHAAPFCPDFNIDIIYSASSYTPDYKGPSAAHPAIEDFVHIASSRVVHDAFESSRQQKVKTICSYISEVKSPIVLRVCWISSGGSNCSKCEKCYRTMMGILAAGYDPNDYGLFYDETQSYKIEHYLKHRLKMGSTIIYFWKDIQKGFLRNKDVVKQRPELKWILSTNFDRIDANPVKRMYYLKRKISRTLNKYTPINLGWH